MHDAPRDIHFKQSRQATYRNTCNWAYFKKHWLCQKLEDLTLSDRKQMKTNHLRIIMKLGKTNPLFWSFWSSYLFIYLFIYLLSLSYLFHISFCSLIVLYRAAPRLRRGGAVRRSSRAARAAPARSKSAVARGRWCNCPPRVQCLVLCRNMSKHVEIHKTI